jgi:hypothetical protein
VTEQRVLIADLVIHKYLSDSKPNWSAADDSAIRPRYWAFRNENPSVKYLERWATNLGHPDLPERIEQVANEFRD